MWRIISLWDHYPPRYYSWLIHRIIWFSFHKEAHFHLSEHSKNHNILATTNSCTIVSLMWWLQLTVLVYYIMCKGISSVIYLQRQDNSLQFAEVFLSLMFKCASKVFPATSFCYTVSHIVMCITKIFHIKYHGSSYSQYEYISQYDVTYITYM